MTDRIRITLKFEINKENLLIADTLIDDMHSTGELAFTTQSGDDFTLPILSVSYLTE